ncbi:hypothetical protein KI387_028337 [Taxus chinensis]|uniref:Germin-like protein n=1 Tax=Taxus chinensis TaxID=29808 RepID=A0AA38FZB4_TAXCH|nr:hypothetical protein KI387_028337 [Taxus chinensis]
MDALRSTRKREHESLEGHRKMSKILEKGDVFVFPKALPHFQENVGHQHAVAIAAFNSQFPGILTIANSLFAANPPIPDSVLAKAIDYNKRNDPGCLVSLLVVLSTRTWSQQQCD